MVYLRIITDFDRLSAPEFSTFTYGVHKFMSERTDFFPNPQPTMAVFGQTYADYVLARSQCDLGDTRFIGERNRLRLELIKMLYRLSCYVLFMANGDRAIAAASGFKLSKEGREKQDVDVPPALRLSPGKQPGEIVARIPKVKGAKSYSFQYTTDEGLKTDVWQGRSSTSCKCLLKGLQQGVRYHVRVGAVGARDQVLFSPIVSRYVA